MPSQQEVRWSQLKVGVIVLVAAVILVTSVHLGWHYAVDGYAAILISWACWWLSKPIARLVHRQPAMIQHNRDLAALAS